MPENAIEPGKATEVYAHQFYNLLEANANLEPVTESEQALVWRGKIMELFNSMGVASNYYTRIRAVFIKYDCVTYVQRGSRAYDSVLILNHPPPESFSAEDLTHVPGTDTLPGVAERVADLENSVKGLENWREGIGGINIGEALRNFEVRIKRLETGENDKDKTKTT